MSIAIPFRRAILAAGALAALVPAARADEFVSGSTGADGALIFDGGYDFQSFDAVYDSSGSRTLAVFNPTSAAQRVLPTMLFQRQETGWRPIFTETMLPYNTEFRLAYDSGRNRLVLFGGEDLNSTRTAETWEYDGSDWTRIQTATFPNPRRSHAMTYDSARDRVVLFGGDTAANSFDAETWEYDGVDWTKITTAATPPGRARHDMAFDSVRNVVVMYGGMTLAGGSTPVRDTWEYNGTNWTQTVAAGGPAFSAFGATGTRVASLAYHATRDRTILGAAGSNNLLWEYNGTAWTSFAPTSFNMPQNGKLVYEPTGSNLYMATGLAITRILFNVGVPGGTALIPASLPVVVDMSGRANGLWNYTGIVIPANASITFVPNAANTPVYWLAQDEVLLAGTISVAGKGGSGRTPGKGGPGGYEGGFGGRAFNVSGSYRGFAGAGPGGGLPGATISEAGGAAGHRVAGSGVLGGAAYGSDFLQPLLGGSGGGGAASAAASDGAGAGGGGGAIRISTSGPMYFANNTINISGGVNSNSGAASSGAVHLLGTKALGRLVVSDNNGNGRVRVEAFDRQMTFSGTLASYIESAPPPTLPQPAAYTITILSVDSTPVANPPSGNVTTPDVTFSDLNQVVVQMDTDGVPQGTVLSVVISSETGTTTVQSTAVAANGTASANATIPGGVGTIQAFATFNVNVP